MQQVHLTARRRACGGQGIGACLALGLLLVACDRTPKPDRKAPPLGASAAPSSSAPAQVPAPWPVGDWRAELEGGVLKIVIHESGEARGSWDRQGTTIDVSGLYEPEPAVLRLKLTSRTFYGTLVCIRQGEAWVGQLQATAEAGAPFENDAGPFGEQWDVRLERAP